MKKIINSPENIVEEMLEGMVITNQDLLQKIDNFNIIVRKKRKEKKVALISGGGSGHEPAHAGYVGHGMLDAAVAGPVFTSPSAQAIYTALKEIQTEKGILAIIKNYSGDVMNFKMAIEMAQDEGINCDYVVVNDDIAIKEQNNRRGIAGTVFVHKIAGAAAEKGYDLTKIKNLAEKAIASIRTMGVALEPCYNPTTGKPSFELGPQEMEFGLGIHGEPGVSRRKLLPSSDIAELLLEDLFEEMNLKDEKIAVMINSLGSTPDMELNILARDINNILRKQECEVYRFFVGNFMTSMEMKGISITLFKLNDQLIKLLNYPSTTIKSIGRCGYDE